MSDYSTAKVTPLRKNYDVIIVGGRPAGIGAAAFLSRAGFDVLLLDRVRFPQPTLSCPIYFSNTIELLDRLGARASVDTLNAPRLHLYRSRIGDIQLEGRILPFRGIDYAFQIRRERFDQAVFEAISTSNRFETRLGFGVSALILKGERVVGVRGRSSAEEDHAPQKEEEIFADLVIGADGFFSTVAESVQAREYKIIPPRTCVFYAYYSNVKPAAPEPCATIYYNLSPRLAFITCDSDCDLTVVSLTLPAARFQETRSRIENPHLTFARDVPELADRLSGAVRETPIYAVAPRRSFYRVPYGLGWALVGDAGFHKDPLPGQGIHDALRSSELLSFAYQKYRMGNTGSKAWNRAMETYRRSRDSETNAMYRLTDFFANLDRPLKPGELNLFRAIASMPSWSNRYVSMFNGVTEVNTFLRPHNQLRILAEWRWNKWRRGHSSPRFARAAAEK